MKINLSDIAKPAAPQFESWISKNPNVEKPEWWGRACYTLKAIYYNYGPQGVKDLGPTKFSEMLLDTA